MLSAILVVDPHRKIIRSNITNIQAHRKSHFAGSPFTGGLFPAIGGPFTGGLFPATGGLFTIVGGLFLAIGGPLAAGPLAGGPFAGGPFAGGLFACPRNELWGSQPPKCSVQLCRRPSAEWVGRQTNTHFFRPMVFGPTTHFQTIGSSDQWVFTFWTNGSLDRPSDYRHGPWWLSTRTMMTIDTDHDDSNRSCICCVSEGNNNGKL